MQNRIRCRIPIFYKHYVDDTYVWKKKNDVDMLFEKLNFHNENIKLI